MAHRDIKPQNILVSDKLCKVCIIDFNVAKKVDNLNDKMTTFCMETMQTGTAGYAAPERFDGKAYTEKIDMWAAGIVLYMLLTGEYPFEVTNECSFLKQVDIIRNGENVMLDLLIDSHISEEAKDLIGSLIVKEPKDRLSAEQALHHVWFKAKSNIEML